MLAQQERFERAGADADDGFAVGAAPRAKAQLAWLVDGELDREDIDDVNMVTRSRPYAARRSALTDASPGSIEGPG